MSRGVFSIVVFFLANAISAAQAEQIYKSDFNKSVSPANWSDMRVFKTPNGKTCIGPFERLSLFSFKQEKLPDHKFVRTRIGILLLGDHVGVDQKTGPDNLSISVVGGSRLLLTNFANRTDDGAAPLQSFPDEYPIGAHPAETGASSKDTSGFGNDSTYHIEVVFPHSDKDLELKFQTGLRHSKNARKLGIESIQIDTLDAPVARTEAEFKKLWKELRGDDPIAANKASWELVASGEPAITFIEDEFAALSRGRATKVRALQKEIAELVKKLQDPDFVVRRTARAKGEALPPEALRFLDGQLKRKGITPEAKVHLKAIAKKIRERIAGPGHPADPELLAAARAIRPLRILQTAQSGRRFKASSGHAPLACLDDGFVPEKADGFHVPRFTWAEKLVRNEWLEVSYPEPQKFDMVSLFWYQDLSYDKGARLPERWRILYRDGDQWKPVSTKEKDYSITAGLFDRIRFDPITTTALRLEVKESPKNVAGLFEFRALMTPARWQNRGDQRPNRELPAKDPDLK